MITNGKLGDLLGQLRDVTQTSPKQWQARCPVHDDKRASLSIGLLDDNGKIGVHCQANCATPDVLAAIGMKMSDLMPPSSNRKSNGKGKIVRTYNYHDTDGTLLFQVCRIEPKDFQQRRPKDGGGWEWKVKGVKQVPYRLPELSSAAPEQIVFVVEGEKDVDRLLGLGLVATCNAGGAGKWRRHHAEYLRDRSIAIIPDNDEPGQSHAEQVAESLAGKATSIKIIHHLPNIPEKGDISDYLDAGGTKRGLLYAVDIAAEWKPEPSPKTKKNRSDDDDDEKASTADKLVELALERYRIGRTETDEAFAVEIGGPNIAVMFKGSRDALRSALSRAYRLEYGKIPNSTALADALTALQGEAYAADPEQVFLRVADHQGKIIVDLGDATGRVVEISPGDWQLLDQSPVLFRRTAATGALPTPERGGSLDELRNLLNVASETWPLALGWLVSAFFPDIPHPILLLGGQQGTGKTTGAKKLVGIIDPSPADVRSHPRDVETWAITAAGSWVVAVDNISTIPEWWSDSLCKAVTGDGWLRRKLFTDGEIAVITFRRVILLTSIDPGALRGDLGDRVVLVDLEPINEEGRKCEADINSKYGAARPRIFGALLDLISRVLTELPNVRLDRMPRMADFARLLAAMDKVMADKADKLSLDIYLDQRGRIAETVIESDLVAMSVRSLLDNVGSWSGTATEFLGKITPEKPPKDWPTTPQSLGARLKRLIPALEQAGIEIDRDREGHSRTRKYYITQVDKGRNNSSASSASSAPTENLGENSQRPADDPADNLQAAPSTCPHPCPHDNSEFPEENHTADNADNADNLLQPLSSWGEI